MGKVYRELVLMFAVFQSCTSFFSWTSNCGSDFVFTSFNGIPISECVEKCIRRSKCVSLNYFRFGHACQLVGNTSTNQVIDFSLINGTRCVKWVKPGGPYESVPSLNNTGVEFCTSGTCNYGEVCDSNAYGIVNCTKQECEIPPAFVNANLLTNTNRIGTKAVYICGNGFEALGGACNKIMCGPSGFWSVTNFTCFGRCRNVPQFTNAQPLSSPLTSPVYTSITYRCVNGTASPGPVVITCLPNNITMIGEWSAPSTVCQKQCGVPSVTSATIYGYLNETHYNTGHQFQFRCNIGFSPAGLQNLTCNSDGTWIPSAICITTVDCSDSLYELDQTYGVCYKYYNSILTAAASISDIFEGTLLTVSSSFELQFAEYVMTVKGSSRLYIGPLSAYSNALIEKWANNEPKANNDCVEMKRSGANYVWYTVSCVTSLDYIIVK